MTTWFTLALMIVAATAAAQPSGTNYDEAKVPTYTLPDPLRFEDGRPVESPDAWRERRRPEILRLFEEHVYGRSPALPKAMRSEVVGTSSTALGGLATRRQVRVLLDGTKGGPSFELLLYVPNVSPRPVPAFLGLNFGGNHSIHRDPGIRLPLAWMRDGPGVVDHRAVDAGRGSGAAAWPVERVLERGYALATFYYGDLEPDHEGGWREGVRARIGPGTTGRFAADDWGAIAAWAWGLRRALDYLQTSPDVDGRKVAVIGHSRLGKAALWAGAQDERFAMVVSNDSGEGGAALARRKFGERTEAITGSFPHWFCGRYREYAGREEALPVDQHELLALMAPRPLYVASATEDLWADPRGEFLAAQAAEPVYRLLGREGLGVADVPAPDRPVGGSIGYHLRTGAHALTAYDWERYLDFADRHLRSAPGTGGAAPETVLLEDKVRCRGETLALSLKRRPFERAVVFSGNERSVAGTLYFLDAVRPNGERLRLWQMFRNDPQTGQLALASFRMHRETQTGRVLLVYTAAFSVFAHELDLAKAVVPLEQEGPVRLEELQLTGSKPAPNEIRVADFLPEDARARMAAYPPEVRGIGREGDRWTVTVAGARKELTFRWEGGNTEWRPSTDHPPRPQP